jgi:hypothetical protein
MLDYNGNNPSDDDNDEAGDAVDVWKSGKVNPRYEKLEGAGNTKRGSITVPLTSCLTGLELAV